MIAAGAVQQPCRGLDDLTHYGAMMNRCLPRLALRDSAEDDEHDEDGRERRCDRHVDLGQGN
jgi:hypothetical protein